MGKNTTSYITFIIFARFIIAYSQIIILLTPDRTWLWRLARSAMKRRQAAAAGWHGNIICGENLLQKKMMSWLMMIHKSLSLLLLLKLLYCGIISKVKENILGPTEDRINDHRYNDKIQRVMGLFFFFC